MKAMTEVEYKTKEFIKKYFSDKEQVEELKFWEDFSEIIPKKSGGFSNEVNEVFKNLIKDKKITIIKKDGKKFVKSL